MSEKESRLPDADHLEINRWLDYFTAGAVKKERARREMIRQFKRLGWVEKRKGQLSGPHVHEIICSLASRLEDLLQEYPGLAPNEIHQERLNIMNSMGKLIEAASPDHFAWQETKVDTMA